MNHIVQYFGKLLFAKLLRKNIDDSLWRGAHAHGQPRLIWPEALSVDVRNLFHGFTRRGWLMKLMNKNALRIGDSKCCKLSLAHSTPFFGEGQLLSNVIWLLVLLAKRHYRWVKEG